eukprot:6977498-Lingulodinium_polyedra.AAC.1
MDDFGAERCIENGLGNEASLSQRCKLVDFVWEPICARGTASRTEDNAVYLFPGGLVPSEGGAPVAE